jgi:hypothetical protein
LNSSGKLAVGSMPSLLNYSFTFEDATGRDGREGGTGGAGDDEQGMTDTIPDQP